MRNETKDKLGRPLHSLCTDARERESKHSSTLHCNELSKPPVGGERTQTPQIRRAQDENGI